MECYLWGATYGVPIGFLAVGGRLFFQGGLVSIRGGPLFERAQVPFGLEKESLKRLASPSVVLFPVVVPSSARVLCSTTCRGCMG